MSVCSQPDLPPSFPVPKPYTFVNVSAESTWQYHYNTSLAKSLAGRPLRVDTMHPASRTAASSSSADSMASRSTMTSTSSTSRAPRIYRKSQASASTSSDPSVHQSSIAIHPCLPFPPTDRSLRDEEPKRQSEAQASHALYSPDRTHYCICN